MSSLTSSLSTLQTEGGSRSLTVRHKEVKKEANKEANRDSEELARSIRSEDGWQIFLITNVEKYMFDRRDSPLLPVPFGQSVDSFAMRTHPFATGAERFVFLSTEGRATYGGSGLVVRSGARLVAKEAKHEENVGAAFHKELAAVQQEAADLARKFNRLVRLRVGEEESAFFLTYIDCTLYRIRQGLNVGSDFSWVLVEPELEGCFTKWNNNAGSVLRSQNPVSTGAIVEEDEGGWSSDEEESTTIHAREVPQSFSHFTYEASQGKQLVCDIQGVWNSEDGYVLTDPVVHSMNDGKRRGATDSGLSGMQKFFHTHRCGALCRQLGFPDRSCQKITPRFNNVPSKAPGMGHKPARSPGPARSTGTAD
eukprot:4103151-Prymnesium_polylepis.1